MDYEKFKTLVFKFYNQHKRMMPWREPEDDGSFNPYKILVSEVMLQQTQVSRVIPKYRAFLETFPTTRKLAQSELGDVLKAWSGLGYNRRAKYLWQTAKQIQDELAGNFPSTVERLTKLPGIGKNTAGAILAYSYNEPAVFMETNIRSVFLHHFFIGRTDVADRELMPLIEATLDKKNPREWCWALMDYGSHLKTLHPNPSRRSQHHSKQSKFSGSKRQLRGWVLRQLSQASFTQSELMKLNADARLPEVLSQLKNEGLIRYAAHRYRL